MENLNQIEDEPVRCDHCKSPDVTPADMFSTEDGAGQDVTIIACRKCVAKYGHQTIVLRFFGLTSAESR